MADMARATADLQRQRPGEAALPAPDCRRPPPPIPCAPAGSHPGPADTLIVSDLHLGLPDSRPSDLLELLHSRPFGRLILLGDIFHDASLRHLDGDAWRLLRHIRQIAADPGRRSSSGCTAITTASSALPIADLLGVAGRESFIWQEQGRRCLALHGDCFDAFVSRHVRFGELCSDVFACCQRRLAPYHGWLSRLEAWQVRMARLGEKVAAEPRSSTARAAFDVVVCGHTHEPLIRRVAGAAAGVVTYANSGAWVGRPASFLTVGPNGLGLDFCPEELGK
jgi:UDP-2,3-diacylglucosamine pyrophosphatase LpxH